MYGMFGSDCGAMPLSVEKRSSPPTNQNANAIAAVIAILLSKFRIFNLPTTLATTIILAVGYIKMFLNIRFHWQRNRLRIFSLSFCDFFHMDFGACLLDFYRVIKYLYLGAYDFRQELAFHDE